MMKQLIVTGLTKTFGQGDNIVHALSDVTCPLKKVNFWQLWGASGSGKTTIISLLQGFYPIQAGRICIGQYDIATLSKEHLRSLIGIVPQNIKLFSGTITSNIALGERTPDKSRTYQRFYQSGWTRRFYC